MNRKIRVLLTSIDAGGGHKQLKINFLNTLKSDPELEVFDYHSPVKFFDIAYKLMIKYLPYAWQYLFEKESTFLHASFTRYIAVIPERRHLRKVLEETKPDIIVTTHFIQSIVLTLEKKRTKANYKIVSCIYDYGAQKGQFHLHTPAEYYLVRDESSKRKSEELVDKDKLFIFGTTVNTEFKETAKLPQAELDIRFKDIIKKYFSRPVDSNKRNILVIGGSGWARNSLDLIKILSKTNEFNIFVSCGRDEELVSKLKELENLYPFGFVPQIDLATIEAKVDAIILSSIAPATIFEICEINKYPLFLHRFIKPQESPHIDLLSEWGIGQYEPDDQKMVFLIKDFLNNKEKFAQMLQNQRRIRSLEEEKAKSNPEVIKEIFAAKL